MYTYLILIIFILLVIALNMKIYNVDILSPSFLYNIAMLMAIICSFLGILWWNDVKTLSFGTVIIIILSVLSFNIGEFFARKIFDKNYKIKKNKYSFQNFPLYKLLIQLIFVIFVFALVYHEVYRISTIVGYKGGNIFKMIKLYRSTSVLFSTKYIEAGIHINIIVAQLQKIAEVICYINIYLLVESILNKNLLNNKNNIVSLFIIIVCIIMSLLIGSRMQMIIYILFATMVYIIMSCQKYSYMDLIKKYWVRAIAVIIIAVGCFYVILPITGRKTDSNIFEYTTFYFGASIPSLNRYLEEEHIPNESFGQETFRGFQNIAYKLKLSNTIYPITTKWESFETKHNTKMNSNIYTSCKRYYNDFGYIGIILLQLLNGFIFAILYILLKKNSSALYIIIYSMFIYTVIDQIRDEYLFSTFIHINTIFKLIVLYCLTYFLSHSWGEFKNEIKNRKFN